MDKIKEQEELDRCNRYFDKVESIFQRFHDDFKKTTVTVINIDEWEFLWNHIKGLNNIFIEHSRNCKGAKNENKQFT